jgi:hypothetical protein
VSSNLPATTGGGAVVPSGGGSVGEYVGDMSVDRGDAQTAPGKPAVVREIEQALGLRIGPAEIQKADEIFRRQRIADDAQAKRSATATMRNEWGPSNYDARIARIHEWLKSLPSDLAEEILGARDSNSGTLIGSKPKVLRALHEIARKCPTLAEDNSDKLTAVRELKAAWGGAYDYQIARIQGYLRDIPKPAAEGLLDARDENGVAIMNRPEVLKWLLQLATRGAAGGAPQGGSAPDLSAISNARRREIEGWMGATRDSPDYKRYYGDPKVQAEYQSLIDQGATGDATATVADTEIDQRIAEIDRWMGARKGSADYKRYWDDPVVQREYAELLERRGSAR